MATTAPITRWQRTEDGASEILTLCVVPGQAFYSECLAGHSPLVVQITTGPGDDFVGLYDLDGERIDLPNPGAWEIAEDVPAAVAEQIRQAWETGNSTVAPLREAVQS